MSTCMQGLLLLTGPEMVTYISFSLNNGWKEEEPAVNRHMFLWDAKTFQFEENVGNVSARASGKDTGGTPHYAGVTIRVDPMPPLNPSPGTNPEPGIYQIDPTDTPSPGETHEYILITEDPYYWVDWYVKAPWDTSERGSYIEGDLGDGAKSAASAKIRDSEIDI